MIHTKHLPLTYLSHEKFFVCNNRFGKGVISCTHDRQHLLKCFEILMKSMKKTCVQIVKKYVVVPSSLLSEDVVCELYAG